MGDEGESFEEFLDMCLLGVRELTKRGKESEPISWGHAAVGEESSISMRVTFSSFMAGSLMPEISSVRL